MKPIILTGILIAESGMSMMIYSVDENPFAALGVLLLLLGITPLLASLLDGLEELRNRNQERYNRENPEEQAKG